MKKVFFALAAVMALAITPAQAGEMMTTTPELALPEAETPTLLPQSSVTEVAPLALPEPETEAAAPYKRCGSRQTVYLTN